jgi:hypothetical protein
LASDEFRADHLHRAPRDCDLVHLVEMTNRRAPVNLHDVESSSALKDAKMKRDHLMDVKMKDDLKNPLIQVVMMDESLKIHLMLDAKMKGDLKNLMNQVVKMDGLKMDDLKTDDHLIDDLSCLVVLNYRGARPYAYSLISIKLNCVDHSYCQKKF